MNRRTFLKGAAVGAAAVTWTVVLKTLGLHLLTSATLLLGITVGVWFYKVARTKRRNPWVAALIGLVASVAGSFFWLSFLYCSGIGGLLRGWAGESPAFLRVGWVFAIISAWFVGIMIAASVRFNLYADEGPCASDYLAVATTLAAVILPPVFMMKRLPLL